jgi:hypothetical protein
MTRKLLSRKYMIEALKSSGEEERRSRKRYTADLTAEFQSQTHAE